MERPAAVGCQFEEGIVCCIASDLSEILIVGQAMAYEVLVSAGHIHLYPVLDTPMHPHVVDAPEDEGPDGEGANNSTCVFHIGLTDLRYAKP